MKANFKIKKKNSLASKNEKQIDESKKLTEKEFEEYVTKAGAAGSFMVFRSKNKKDEMGLDEL